ncbi:MAG TPA: helix-turn-helix transcriptional regulator [Streptosporangiaceae bacterium]|nr:helix-turn-helix transcriptional regulator [Streptosporangiaceae bacterium]
MSATLGQRLRTLRKEQGLSQTDLAGDLVSPSYVSLIEAGRRSPEREVLEGLAQKLGCSPAYLETGIVPEEVTEQRLALQFAEIALANGSVDEARAQFGELASSGNREIRLGALWGLARAEETLGNLHVALTHRDALLAAARGGEPGAPKLLSLLIGRCRLYRDAGDFSRSIEVGEDALREVRELGLEGTEEEIRLASTLVMAYWGRGDLFSAQHLASQVIERAERLGSRTAQGNAYWNASLVAASRGQLALALDLATKTLALLSESSEDRTLGGMRITYAWLLLQCDPPQLDEADALLSRAHEVLSGMAMQHDLARCETEMARSALLHGDFGTAIGMAGQAIGRCSGTSTAELDARVVRGLAMVMDGQARDGATVVTCAADSLERLGSGLLAARAYRDLAEALLQRGQPDEAITALQRAADCAGVRSSSIRSAQQVVAEAR